MRAGHELCEWAKTHAADELAALREKHPLFRVLRAVVARATQPTSKQASEWRRRQSIGRRYEVGLIEYEFGGPAEAWLGFPYDPTCLDAILMGYGVPMEYLEWLFEMEHHRFPKKLPSVRDGRKILYSPFRRGQDHGRLAQGEATRTKTASARWIRKKAVAERS
jgi:hypothetical protein